MNRRCHRGRAVSPCPHPTRPVSPQPEWGPALAQRGCAGSCPAPRALVPGRRAAERNGAVRWNLGAGGDGAAGGGRARHVAAYVRRVQGRTGRRPGRQGHRRGDAGPPPHTRRRVRGQTRTLRAARGTDGHCPAPWARHVCARARGRGHTCAGVGGQGPAGPLVSPCCWCPGYWPQRRAWLSCGVPGSAEMSPRRDAPATALPAPHRALMNGSGGSSGTRTPQSVCAIDFSCTAAEKGAGDGVAAGTPAGWHCDGSHVPCCPCPRSPWGQCQTEDPPASPWDAQHGPSGPDAGVPPVPCCHLPAQPSPRPAPRWAQGGRGWSSQGDAGSRGTAVPARVTSASLRSHTLPAASFRVP